MKDHPEIKRIALIDDDIDDCELFGEALHEFDPTIKLSCLSNNERLIQFLEEKQPELIFLDVNMPRKNGYDCLGEIRGIRSFNEIPVIMYSNTGRVEDIERAYKMGAQLFIRKPSTFKLLVDGLKEVVSKDWRKPKSITAQYVSNGKYHPFAP